MAIWNFLKAVSVRGLVLSPDGQSVCLIRREKRGVLYYVAPGGGLEKNEQLIPGLRREVLEETGLTIDSVERRGVIEFESTQQVYFSAVAQSTALHPTGQESSLVWQKDNGLFHPEWISFKNLAELPFVSPLVLNLLKAYPQTGWPPTEFQQLEKTRATRPLKVS